MKKKYIKTANYKPLFGRGWGMLLVILVLLSSCSPVKQSQKTTALPKLQNPEEQKFYYYYYEAIRLRDNQKYDQALETFLLCYEIDSLNPGLNSDLGILYASIGFVDEAEKHLRKAVISQPKNWWYNVRLINLLAERKKYNEAIKLVTALQKNYPFKEDVYYMLASLYTETNQLDKAIGAYDQMEKIVGINEILSFEKFRLYVQANKPKKGIAEIDKLIEEYPAETRYKVLRGDIYMQQKQPEMALAVYEEVMAEDPQNPYVYISLSEYYNTIDQPDKALELIVNALKNDKLDIETKMGILGKYIENLIIDEKKIDETEDLFRLLVEHHPLEEQVHAYYTIFLQYQGRKEDMIDELETILYINPQNEGAWVQVIQTYFVDKDYEKVIEISDKGIENLPDLPGLYFYKLLAENLLKEYEAALQTGLAALELLESEKESNKALQSDFYAQIGDIYYHLDQKDKAFEAYENALKTNPGNIYTMNNYAYYLSLEKENLRHAERLSAKTVEMEPKNSTFLDTYAWILYQQGNYSLAKFYIERAVDNLQIINPDENGVIYDHYGDILWRSGDHEKANEMWEKALEAGLNTEELKQKIELKSLPEEPDKE